MSRRVRIAQKDNGFTGKNLGTLGKFGGHRLVEEVDTILPVKFGLKRRSVDRDRSRSNLRSFSGDVQRP